MRKLRKAIIIIVLILLLFRGNYLYGYYMGYHAQNSRYYDRILSTDQRYAIEIHCQPNGLIEPDLIIVCEDLMTHKKVDYMIIYVGMFSMNSDIEDIFHIKWYDNRAELTAWVEEDVITTYILDWDMIFSDTNKDA